MVDKPDYEAQLVAMRTVMEALGPLDEGARESVLVWVTTQLGIKQLGIQKNENASKQIETPQAHNGTRQGTVSVVAQKLGAQSARDLLVAAATHLTAYQGKDSFTRDELVACAKDARNWKANYSNQIAINIKRMSDAGVLFEKARDVYSLSEATLKDVEERLAG
jgi:hypothetical protein